MYYDKPFMFKQSTLRSRPPGLYPDSAHVKTLALIQSEDVLIWEYAKANDFVIVSKRMFEKSNLLLALATRSRGYTDKTHLRRLKILDFVLVHGGGEKSERRLTPLAQPL